MTHGLRWTPEYEIWIQIKGRCLNPKNKGYKNYGGRGIKICSEWRDDFLTFLEGVGKRPHPKLTLDRRNNDGDYEPFNMRWTTKKNQSANRRSALAIVVDGETMTAAEACRSLGLKRGTIARRLRIGIPMDKVMHKGNLPVWLNRKRNSKGHFL
jgi:hypothetical protein